MRKLVDHIVDGDSVNHRLQVVVVDEPGDGGANHYYEIGHDEHGTMLEIAFQHGPIKEVGINGVTQEALLAIVIDRLAGFQAGPYATGSNNEALAHCRQALYFLHYRTRERIARGVEGTLQV